MSPSADLEERLRRGLHTAARALPPAPAAPPRPSPALKVVSGRHSRRWLAGWIGAAAAVAVVVCAVAATRDGTEDPGSVRIAPATTPEQPTTTATPADPGPPRLTNGMVPGQAVLVDPDPEIRSYNPEGVYTESVDLSSMEENIQAAASDLAGGWVICGTMRGTLVGDELVWFPAGGEPVSLAPVDGGCSADAVRVVDSPQGPTAIFGGLILNGTLTSVVLATGETHQLSLQAEGFARWSASTGRVLVQDDAGFHLYDLATMQALPIAAIDVGFPSDVALAPDASTVAFLTGDLDLYVYDLATGDELYRETFPLLAEGAQLSYDGAVVAVGSAYEGSGPVTVIHLGTGDRYQIDVAGLVL